MVNLLGLWFWQLS